MPDDDHLPHDGPTEDWPTEGWPTEDWARGLLLAAADTIEVRPEPRPFVATPRRVAWIPLAAAATVLAVLGIVGVTQLGGTGGTPAIPPSPPATTSESLGPDQIPSVFGYDATGARRLLESKGLAVNTRLEESCEPVDRAVRTDPPVGSSYAAGDDVTLVVTEGARGSCIMDHARTWEFLDFANRRGPAVIPGRRMSPEFAPEVTLTVNGQSTVVTAEQAADPASWPTCDTTLASCPGSALDVIQQASAVVRQWEDGTWESPTLSVQRLFRVGGRDGRPQPSVVPWDRQRIWIGFPRDDATDRGFRPWHITLHWQPLSSRPTSVLTEVELRWKELSVVTDP